MSTKNKFFISCEEAKHICDKSQYGEASFWERVKLSIRLSWCRITRAYSGSNVKLTKLIKESKIEAIEKDRKEEMQRKLQEEMSK
ncbi:hypothetical protein IMCC3317_20100 [Kordia antarctica]|uniref:Uncharacterized protein n=1 Tax=Kordia antarctica TaxID=1218801 RepID=A0A7L4ZJJ6_9FLAO|nr:hypothetical protein [Kordia antarctica]QHI36647.1 hypothetical protein IMCC3317_20100 [Kordia antarctica]